MRRSRTVLGLVAGLLIVLSTATPASAETSATLQVQATLSGYGGGNWDGYFSLGVACDGQEAVAQDVTINEGPVDVEGLGPLTEGMGCDLWVSSWPNAGDAAYFEGVDWPDGSFVVLQPGANLVTLVFDRAYAGEWPPPADTVDEHSLDLMTVDTITLNRYGGITVEGRLSCETVAAGLGAEVDAVVLNVDWSAIQYIGRKTSLTASYASGIGSLCWLSGEPGPYDWGTFFSYPSGATQWIYSPDGKFGGGSIHVDALAYGQAFVISQNFDDTPDSPWGRFDLTCQDSNNDGFCVAEHWFYGPAQADLKPVKVR